jgi:hypothetical protein
VLLEDYTEQEQHVKKAYMPVYGCQPLDDYAAKVFQELGCQVVELPTAIMSRRKGAIRCSSQVLDRDCQES